VYSGRAVTLTGEDLDPSASRALLWRLFAAAEELLDAGSGPRIVTGANDSDGPLLLRWVRERHGGTAAAAVERLLLQRGGNSAGEGIVSIDARGRVHPDQFWQQAVLGDVRRDPWPRIMAHPLLSKLRRRLARLRGRCGACRFAPLCRGSHRERALSVTGDLWGPDPACVMRDEEIRMPAAARVAMV
jgi:radical SAM protein with 4Fe4S-binding SPASM domain